MESIMPFGEILEAVDKLSIGDQESIRDILAKRIIGLRRDQLSTEIAEAHKEHEAGQCRPVTPDEIMTEIMS
ncbi:MAG: hypothetical protein JRJ47_13845 [Deltaproteobacteria bacterium]|nr:hypothetical protein [Deltaproteobacteria bacterium]